MGIDTPVGTTLLFLFRKEKVSKKKIFQTKTSIKNLLYEEIAT